MPIFAAASISFRARRWGTLAGQPDELPGCGARGEVEAGRRLGAGLGALAGVPGIGWIRRPYLRPLAEEMAVPLR